jgi:MFS family permease
VAGAQPSSRTDQRALLAALAGASLSYSLMQSLVIPALPAIQHALDGTPDETSWAVTGFLLTSAVATPIAGRFGDMFGKRRVLIAILLIVCAGTLLCVIPTITALIAGRAIQGVSGGVLPLGYAIVRDECDEDQIPRGIALLASLLGVGGGLGVILAGVIVEHLSYTWIFWLQLPTFLVVAFLVQRHVPESRSTVPARIDWLGAALLSVGLVSTLITLTQARSWGVASVPTTLGVVIAVAAFALWVRSATHTHAPLIDLRLLRPRPIWTTNLVAFLVGVAQFAGFILIPQYVQEPASTGYGLGASPLSSGVYLIPMTVGVLLAGFAVGPLEHRYGLRPLLIAGTVSLVGAFIPLTFARSTPAEIYLASSLLGIGVGMALSALAAITVASVQAHQTGVSSAVNNVARTLGGAVGGQIAAAILATAASADGLPTADGFDAAFAVGLVAVVVATLIGPLLPGPVEEVIDAQAFGATRHG